MNKVAGIVAESIIGEYHKKVKLGKVTFEIYEPTIKDLCRIFGSANIVIADEIEKPELISIMPEKLNDVSLSLSIAVSINKGKLFQKFAYWYISKYATIEQIESAFKELSGVIFAKDFFESIPFDRTQSEKAATIIGGKTLYGSMLSFMENLHISYREAFDVIPYPQMLVMSADKLRALSPNEQLVGRGSGKEMAKRRKERR